MGDQDFSSRLCNARCPGSLSSGQAKAAREVSQKAHHSSVETEGFIAAICLTEYGPIMEAVATAP